MPAQLLVCVRGRAKRAIGGRSRRERELFGDLMGGAQRGDDPLSIPAPPVVRHGADEPKEGGPPRAFSRLTNAQRNQKRRIGTNTAVVEPRAGAAKGLVAAAAP